MTRNETWNQTRILASRFVLSASKGEGVSFYPCEGNDPFPRECVSSRLETVDISRNIDDITSHYSIKAVRQGEVSSAGRSLHVCLIVSSPLPQDLVWGTYNIIISVYGRVGVWFLVDGHLDFVDFFA